MMTRKQFLAALAAVVAAPKMLKAMVGAGEASYCHG